MTTRSNGLDGGTSHQSEATRRFKRISSRRCTSSTVAALAGLLVGVSSIGGCAGGYTDDVAMTPRSSQRQTTLQPKKASQPSQSTVSAQPQRTTPLPSKNKLEIDVARPSPVPQPTAKEEGSKPAVAKAGAAKVGARDTTSPEAEQAGSSITPAPIVADARPVSPSTVSPTTAPSTPAVAVRDDAVVSASPYSPAPTAKIVTVPPEAEAVKEATSTKESPKSTEVESASADVKAHTTTPVANASTLKTPVANTPAAVPPAKPDRLAELRSQLQQGRDVNDKDDQGRTLLQQSAIAGDLTAVEMLLDWGANASATDRQGLTALHWAASSGHQEICELLIASGEPVDVRGTIGDTPLYWAATFDRRDTAELLIARGADVNAADQRGKTPLHAAVEGDARNVVDVLVAHGADVRVRDENGLTLLHQAVLRARRTILGLAERGESAADHRKQRQQAISDASEMIKLLVEKGADVNASTPRAITPLHLAAWDDTRELAEALIKCGADRTAADSGGKTPVDYARQREQTQVATVLSQ